MAYTKVSACLRAELFDPLGFNSSQTSLIRECNKLCDSSILLGCHQKVTITVMSSQLV